MGALHTRSTLAGRPAYPVLRNRYFVGEPLGRTPLIPYGEDPVAVAYPGVILGSAVLAGPRHPEVRLTPIRVPKPAVRRELRRTHPTTSGNGLDIG